MSIVIDPLSPEALEYSIIEPYWSAQALIEEWRLGFVPHEPCSERPGYVYAYFEDVDGLLLYIGKTVNPKERHKAHSRAARWWFPLHTLRSIWQVCCETHALDLETFLIFRLKPAGNTAGLRIDIPTYQRTIGWQIENRIRKRRGEEA